MAINTSDLANGQVITGFSFPVVAKYTESGGSITYSSGMILARGVDVDTTIETVNGDNTFYADNRAAETAQEKFKSGSAKLTVDGLLTAAEKLIMGLPNAGGSITVGSTSVTTTDYDDDQVIPYVGLGFVVASMSNGVEIYRAWIYPKCRFKQFDVSAKTLAEEIDWQTTSLEAKIVRDNSAKHRWQRVSEPLETELEAYNVVRAALGLAAAEALPET